MSIPVPNNVNGESECPKRPHTSLMPNDMPPISFPDIETLLQNYLENTPGSDKHGEWNIQKAQVWLEVGTVIRRLKVTDTAFTPFSPNIR
jgi:hypothetical protein